MSRGPVEWMVHNRITANILMLIFLVGGFYFALNIKKEVFPAFDIDSITVSVALPGASPEETEKSIALVIESELADIEGLDEISAVASEGSARVTAEIREGENRQQIFQEVQEAVSSITTFPEDSEEPGVTLNSRSRDVLTIALYGDANEWTIRELAETLRDRLLLDPDISKVELDGARDYEVQIEVSRDALERYSLTLGEISSKIATEAVEVGGGTLKTEGGEILIRFNERRFYAEEFAKIPILISDNGTPVPLSQIATITDGFVDNDRKLLYDGEQGIALDVYRVGEETPILVSDAARKVLAEFEAELPPGIKTKVHFDRADIYRARLQLLLKNAAIGLGLILLFLGLFLEFRLAFWVAMGIPISFLGAFLFLPAMGASVNMVSMFAFIIALGIVVDDAIIAGENIYEYRERGYDFITASIKGIQDVAVPLSFSILTNIAAFSPLLFIPGTMGKIFIIIPIVVIVVFLISWFEALFIMPTHLAYSGKSHDSAPSRFINRNQLRISNGLKHFVHNIYKPFLLICMRYRYVTIAAGFAALFIVTAYAASGRMGFSLMPRVESNRAVATAILPVDAPFEEAERVNEQLVQGGLKTIESIGQADLLEGYRSRIYDTTVWVSFYLIDGEERDVSTQQFNNMWRKNTGTITGIDSVRYKSDIGGPGGGQAALSVELSHRDIDTLDRASDDMARVFADFPSIRDIEDSMSSGKEQFEFTLKPLGQSLGLTANDIARQVRESVYGSEALRQQRGPSEVKVFVRLPESERSSIYDLEQLKIKTPDGGYVPLYEVADVQRNFSPASISRREGRRAVTVSANVQPVDDLQKIVQTIQEEVFPEFSRNYPGLTLSFQGRQARTSESMASLKEGFLLVLIILYVMLAIPFRSYTQPLVVMMAIPFGVVGALLGHLVMGYSLSVISIMGIVALAGVVVNDSLILVDYANKRREQDKANAFDAIVSAGTRRFRPVMLTTITTFGGLAPMIFETSIQAKFLIPMAISLGYGILFATAITLLLVPAFYLILEDAHKLFGTEPIPIKHTPAPNKAEPHVQHS